MTRVILIVLSALLTGAHFVRGGDYGLTAAAVLAPGILLFRTRWSLRIIQLLLIVSAFVWLNSMIQFISIRQAMMLPYTRLVIILGSVILLQAITALSLESSGFLNRFPDHGQKAAPVTTVFTLVSIILTVVHLKVDLTMLIAERFFPGFGWLEILIIAVYGSYITDRILDPARSALWRKRIWILFSFVFFGQLIIGLFGLDKFLMTGELHLPVPAVIVAGPLFRGEGFFMPILFLSTVILIGPAWCSHICYIGAWDAVASGKRRVPKKLSPYRKAVRWYILGAVIAVTLILRLLGISTLIATISGAIFGLIGVAVMLYYSRKYGSMVHCVTYCPIGPLAGFLGKINPFRIRINDSCDECGKCRLRCRYDALNKEDIIRRKPDLSCTLCGDCITSCPHNALEYRFLKMKPENARRLFLVLVISLHACTLALARI